MSSKRNLQLFLKDHGVQYIGYEMNKLAQMYRLATESCLEIHSNGIHEDISSIIASKLQLDNTELLPLLSSCEGNADTSFVPKLTVIDRYNYLMAFSQYDHSSLCDYSQVEGYNKYQDGYAPVHWLMHPDYVAVKAQVKP